ncbi:hypothetical protein BH10CYA1_BH10CYA1_54880 [soil metagenome]
MLLLKIRYWIVTRLFDFYIKQNMYDKALPIGIVLAELYEQIEGRDNIASAQFYARIADLHFKHDAHDKAEELYKHSLELAQRQLHPSDPVIDGLIANIQNCSAAPNVVPSQLELNVDEIEAERIDQALINAVAQINQQRGPSQSLQSVIPGLKKIDSELDYWSRIGNSGKVKLVLQNGEDVNQRWENGRTALHTAASGNHVQLVELLLSVGADRNARLTSGETALDLAQAEGHQEVTALLDMSEFG